MRISRLHTLEDMRAVAPAWNELAGDNPFRSTTWLHTWWKHYGSDSPHNELYTLVASDENNEIVGIAPWYCEKHLSRGRIVRFLAADDEVCSDYLGILCRRGLEEQVAKCLAEWLSGAFNSHGGFESNTRWDLIDLSGVAPGDVATGSLAREMESQGNLLQAKDGPLCWQLQIPASFDEYLAKVSRDCRKRFRRLDKRVLDSRIARYVIASTQAEFEQGWQSLIDLHQKRRQSSGDAGCFSWPRFQSFHDEVAQLLFSEGHLRLHWIELESRVVAVEYSLFSAGVIYAYQSGMDPEFLDAQPGTLLFIAALRAAIESGESTYDFMRGDEAYKLHWRAEPRETTSYLIIPARTVPRVRHGVWQAAQQGKSWLKRRLKPASNG